MEDLFYMLVKANVAVYVLFRLWKALFGGWLAGVFDRMFSLPDKKIEPEAVPEASDADVIGETHIAYLEDSAKPAEAENKENPFGFPEAEEINPDDIEIDLRLDEPTEEIEEGFIPCLREDVDDTDMEQESSTGLTYTQIANAVDVLTSVTDDDTKVMEAAQAVYNVQHTDLFKFFATQVSNEETIEKLFAECLDGNGNPLPQRKTQAVQAELDAFSWEKFV